MDNRNQRSDNLFALVVVLRVELAVVLSRSTRASSPWLHCLPAPVLYELPS